MSLRPLDSMIGSNRGLTRLNAVYLILGIVTIAAYYILSPESIVLFLGIVFFAGGIAGMFAGWQGISRYYYRWIEVLPPIVAGLLVIWVFRALFVLPLAIGAVLTGLARMVRPDRRELGFALMALGCLGSAILAYNTASLLTTAILVGGAIWMGAELYRHR